MVHPSSYEYKRDKFVLINSRTILAFAEPTGKPKVLQSCPYVPHQPASISAVTGSSSATETMIEEILQRWPVEVSENETN